MAWRPYENLIEGILDNTQPGKVTGWIRFFRAGKDPLEVRLELTGNCHRDLQGRRFRIFNPHPSERDPYQPLQAANPDMTFPERRTTSYVEHLDPVQKGEAGDITAGDAPQDYVKYPYIEWYSEANGRVVLELERSQLEILTPEQTFWPTESNRAKQHENMKAYLGGMVEATGAQFGAVIRPSLDSHGESAK